MIVFHYENELVQYLIDNKVLPFDIIDTEVVYGTYLEINKGVAHCRHKFSDIIGSNDRCLYICEVKANMIDRNTIELMNLLLQNTINHKRTIGCLISPKISKKNRELIEKYHLLYIPIENAQFEKCSHGHVYKKPILNKSFRENAEIKIFNLFQNIKEHIRGVIDIYTEFIENTACVNIANKYSVSIIFDSFGKSIQNYKVYSADNKTMVYYEYYDNEYNLYGIWYKVSRKIDTALINTIKYLISILFNSNISVKEICYILEHIPTMDYYNNMQGRNTMPIKMNNQIKRILNW